MIAKSAALGLMMFVSINIMPETKIPDFYVVEWKEQTTKINLPVPFNEVNITITKSHSKLDGIFIETDENKICLEGKLLEGIEDISEPEFSYEKSDFDRDKKINSFKMYFEYGKPKFVNLGNDVPGCESPCMEPIRDIVVFTISADYKVSREFKNYNFRKSKTQTH